MTSSQDDLPRLSSGQAEQLAAQLAELAGSGRPLADGLRAAADEAASGRLARALRRIARSVDRGRSLEDVLASARRRLPRYVGHLIAAALRSGNFAAALGELVQHHRLLRQLRQTVTSALAYPALVLSLALGLFVFFHVAIVPVFDRMYQEFELKLPTATLSLIWWSRTGVWMLLVFLGLALGAMLFVRIVGGRTWWSRVWATVPMIGSLSHWAAVADWSRMMAILVEQQVPLPEALRLAADGTYDGNLSEVSRDLARRTDAGGDLAQLLAASYRLPALLAPLVESGQRAGSLAAAFRTASDMYEMRVRLRAVVLRSVLPPLVFIIVGIQIGLYVVGLFLPLAALIRSI